MQADDPPYLSVGTAVSAKYKGAFCEAKVSKVVRIVKCKVTYKMGLGTATVSDEQIKGTLRVGHTVQAKHPEKKEFIEATIAKIQDCSQYTVVFDDGDITTLRRSALCLKSGRHFNESETLDQLPLTHPEHFGNPVVGGRRGRRNRQLKEDSSEGEAEEENEPDLEGYSIDIGKVVGVETTDKKRGKDNWFPGLVVIPSAQPTVRINVKDEYLIRSFKDGRYYTVPKKEVSEFNRDVGDKVESSLAEAVGKAIKYLDNNELPVHWERNSLFNMQTIDSDSDENYTDSSDDEPNEEKDRFVAQLYKFMDDSGTPLNKSPMIGNKDVDLHKLFRMVHKLGGYNRVTNKNKWRLVTTRLKLPTNQVTFNQVKNVYKKCLLSYESFYKTLGVTMLNHNMSAKKNRGRSLIRDKDRATPVNSPKPEKDEDNLEKKDDEKSNPEEKKKKPELKKDDEKRRKELVENSDTNSSDATDQSESLPSTSKDVGRPRRLDRLKEKKSKIVVNENKVKPETVKKEDEEKTQQTRSKSQTLKPKEAIISNQKKDVKVLETTPKVVPKQQVGKKVEEEKKRGRKKLNPDEKPSVEIVTDILATQSIHVGDKLKVFYGPTHEYKVTYEAKVLEIEKDSTGLVYLVHYTGWNTRYDEWIAPTRIAENLSGSSKKKMKQANAASSSTATKSSSTTKTTTSKRGRGTSVVGRPATTSSSSTEAPRSTTPSSVTSSSSRTKSPATPATRSASRMTRLDYGRRTRRTSAQTDISNHSESDSEISESETELTRTRSGNKSEEVEIRTYRKKIPRTPTVTRSEKLREKDDADTEKDEETERPKRIRKLKKSPEKSGDDSDDDNGSNLPKGRDFDLNQIRSELKGFNKAVKVPSLDTAEKEVLSSSDDSNTQPAVKTETIEEKKEIKPIETSPTSDDIYEFKEPEPFEFESRAKMVDEKTPKKRIPRLYEDIEKSPKKKTIKSPGKSDKDSPELEKKRFRRTPVRKQDDSDEDEKKEDEDPFDKLVVSPSFNLKPVDKNTESKTKLPRTAEEALNVFRDTVEDYTGDIDLSDNESQGQHLFTRDLELFSGTFTKYSPERNLDLEFSTKVEDLKKENDDLESIRESITRAIERTPSSDECDNLSDDDDELVITTSTATYQGKKRETESEPVIVEKSEVAEPTKEEKVEPKVEVKEEIVRKSPLLQISPALQETDSSLLESICAAPLAITTKLEDTKDLNLKTGTRIADSLLQKFSSIKNKSESSPKHDSDSEQDIKKEVDKDAELDDGVKLIDVSRMIKQVELKVKPSEMEVKKAATPTKIEPPSDVKKRRKIISRAYIEESDSNSSDSEQLVIARSDEDSQTNSLDKPDLKESDSNMSTAHIETTDDSQSQEEQRNFKFDTIEKSVSPEPIKEDVPEPENVKEDEPDSQLHSLLLCEETIPRSPAPASEGSSVVESRPKTKSVLEMPFASAPGNCNNKSMLLNSEHNKPAAKPQPPPLVLPLANRDNRDVSTVITPPSTPGSSTSGDHGELSPNTIENESCKSNDAEPDYPRKRRNSSLNKVPLYSEEDTQMTNEHSSGKKSREEPMPASCRKRRKSIRGADEVPAKRGRKPLNRSRHNSDSDDTSEHSLTGSATNVVLPTSYDRTSKSPRPSKYNFFVEFDPSLNSGQRIAVLQQKLSELRKTYAEVKTELAAVERRRKKIRRREREALKASKQEMVCG